jgi:hypothetical protein
MSTGGLIAQDGSTGSLETAAALWPELSSKAGLTGPRENRRGKYDADLLAALKEALFPDQAGDLDALIAASDLSAEALLRAFFATMQPFAEMKKDILAMLAEAGAHASGDALRIRFNFDEDGEPLDLLLAQFRSQMERIVEVFTPNPPRIEIGDLWALAKAGFEDQPYGPPPWVDPLRLATVIAWLADYEAGAPFRSLESGWRVDDPETDARLDRVVRLMNAVLARFRQHGRTRTELAAVGHDPLAGDVEDESGLSIYQLWIIESDSWPRAIVHWIFRVHEAFFRGDTARMAQVLHKVDALLPEFDDDAGSASALARVLEDILDLPVWKHRHEVYAVWLGAQIHRGLSQAGWRFRFHLVEDRLEFAFRGVHLATLLRHDSEPELYWWTELRSEHADLPNAHRTTGIQPDYRIRRAPLSAPDPDVLVLEAKQHLRSANREFREAIEDYAHACPQAGVLLANHGPCGKTLMAQVAPEASRRALARGNVHPGDMDNVEQLRDDVARVVDCALTGEVAQAFLVPCEITLTWGALPADLDLHVYPQAGGHLFYQQPRGEGAELGPDVTSGYGPERATVHAANGVYAIAVHQFSESGDLSASGAVVEIAIGPHFDRSHHRFEVPPGEGRWWHVASVDMRTSAITAAQIRNDVLPRAD